MASGANYFAESVRISPRDGYLLGQYAQSLFFADGNRFTGRVSTAVDNAFAVDSSNQTVLGLKGIEAFENSDYKLAITYWQGAAQQLILPAVTGRRCKMASKRPACFQVIVPNHCSMSP